MDRDASASVHTLATSSSCGGAVPQADQQIDISELPCSESRRA